LQVVLAGFAEYDPVVCGSCGSLNGTYVVDFVGDIPEPGCTAQACSWWYTFDPEICYHDSLQAFFAYDPIGEQWIFQVSLTIGGAGVDWKKTFAAKPRCDVLNNTDIPNAGTWVDSQCDPTVATCVVTAL
jgi:hypothetical protein